MANQPEVIQHPLDLNENFSLHRKGWQVQPFGLGLILLIAAAGILGLFGEGWLSNRKVQQGAAQVQYQKYTRLHSNLQLQLSTTNHGSAVVAFPLSYLEGLEIESIVPQPTNSFISQGQVWYVFADKHKENIQVRFYFQPETIGSVKGYVRMAGQVIPLHHFIYP